MFPPTLRRAALVAALWSGLGVAMALALPGTPAGKPAPDTDLGPAADHPEQARLLAPPATNRPPGY